MKISACLFFAFLFLYLTTSSGGFESGDAVARYETAKSILHGQGGALPPSEVFNSTYLRPDGKLFATYGPLQSLVQIPLIAVSESILGKGVKGDNFNRAVFSLGFTPLISALALLFLFLALQESKYERRAALIAVLLMGVATPYWYYARTAQEENLLAVAYAAWFWGAARFQNQKTRGLTLMSLAGAGAIATRWAAGPPLAVLAVATLVLLFRGRQNLKKGELAVCVCALISVVTGLLWYNHSRFGSIFETGYALAFGQQKLTLFSVHDSLGRAAALLVSPYRGLFFYTPILILTLFCLGNNRRPSSFLEKTGAGSFVAAFLLNCFYGFWAAGYSWGPRFLIAPLFLLAPWVARNVFRFEKRRAILALLVFSAGIQFFSVLVPVSVEEHIRDAAGIQQFDSRDAWDCWFTPVCLRPGLAWQAIRNTVSGGAAEGIFWWPFRFAWLHLFSRLGGAVIALVSISLSLFFFAIAWKKGMSQLPNPTTPLKDSKANHQQA